MSREPSCARAGGTDLQELSGMEKATGGWGVQREAGDEGERVRPQSAVWQQGFSCKDHQVPALRGGARCRLDGESRAHLSALQAAPGAVASLAPGRARGHSPPATLRAGWTGVSPADLAAATEIKCVSLGSSRASGAGLHSHP